MRALVVIAALGVVAMSAATATAADPALGQKVFETKCSRCHGKDGKGNAKMGAMLKTTIPDLTTTTGAKTEPELAKFISEGKKPMPPQKMGKDELDAVAHYVKSLGGSAAK